MTKKQLKAMLKEERELYLKSDSRKMFKQKIEKVKRYEIWKALYWLRHVEYFQKKTCGKWFTMCGIIYSTRKMNSYSSKAGVEIRPGYTAKGLNIWHGGVVINGLVGENCIFHGNNIIGNKKSGSTSIPKLGRNVEVGANAVVIGNVEIADNCVIGAGAVVTKSFFEPGTIIAGVPAKMIGKVSGEY